MTSRGHTKTHTRSKSGTAHERERDKECDIGLSQSCQRYSRPTSLYPLRLSDNEKFTGCDGLQPEREPIRFDVNLIGAPPEVEQLVENIKRVAEQFLYHWKTFPIVLPTPVSRCDSYPVSQIASDGSLGRYKQKFHLRDLFLAPSFDELDAVAIDGKGEPRKLSGKQLECIRERGEFEVESINFPGQKHRWKLSEVLQKGFEKTRESLLNDLALALRFMFVTAKGRIFSEFFSVAEAARGLLRGLLRILDIVLGVPGLQAHNLDLKIREERNKYLVAELLCRPENEDSLELLCSFIRKQLRRAAMEKFEVTRECSQPPVALPYRFLTPSGFEVDLRLWDRSLMRKILPILVGILERETRGWFLHFRERLIAELRTKKMPDEDIEREVNEAVMKEYLQRVYNCILSHPDIVALGDGIAQLLVQQAQSVVLMHRAVENVQHRLQKSLEQQRQRLSDLHPVLSRIAPWLRARLRNSERRFIEENEWSCHEGALALCNTQRLLQTVYFLNRDLAFMREREPALTRELRKDETPTRTFFWPTQIWLPSNWIVRRNFQGQSEIVPTVLSKQATSITTPRSDPSQPVFLIEKETVRATTTRWPLWRLFNYFHRTWCWTWNAMFFFGIVLPWCSPVGLRALFLIEPFMPDLELSQINGTLFPRKSSLTPTLTSRLLKLWRHISKSRTHFETKPDTGFIGKGFTRHVNRIWNYFFKGLFGTLGLVIVFPTVCTVVIISSFLIALTSALWMPLLTAALQLTNMLVYDLDSPEQTRNRIFVIGEALVWNIGIEGLVQPIVAIFVAAFLCPMVSLIILTGGLFRYFLRLLWDALLFHAVVRKRGRVPSSDGFIVRRVAGPGLASDYHFRIGPEQALAAFEAKMEWDELAAYQTVVESTINQPQKDFGNFVEACFGSFSTQLSKSTGAYRDLEKEAQDLTVALHEKLEKRRRELQTGLSVSVKSKIKLSTADLKIAIQQGALMLERFYPDRIFPKLGCTEEQFWECKALNVADWAGLAGLLYSELFSLDILTPLTDTDTSFRLDPHPQADLGRYTEMVQCVQLGASGPDLLGNVYTPRGNIHIHSPYLDVSAFNPRSKLSSTGKKIDKKAESTIALGSLKVTRTILRMPWKRPNAPYTPDKMAIPLPIPHPAHIAVTIYNRDSDEPIPLESEICVSILRGIEESHVSPDDSGIGRFKGGADSYETTSSSSDNTLDVPAEAPVSSQAVSHQWTLNNWGQRKRKNSGSVRVDLASPEDVTLDSDSTRVVFCTYGTTV